MLLFEPLPQKRKVIIKIDDGFLVVVIRISHKPHHI